MDKKYKKLKEIALSAEKIVLWNFDGEPYTGPINPKAIIIETSTMTNYLGFKFVLAELVSPQDLGSEARSQFWDNESSGGYITAGLNNDFEFEKWDPASKTLVFCDFENSPDGTLWGDCENLAHNYPKSVISTAILFIEQEGKGSTCRLMQKT